jgi:hypothetical protein
MIQELGEKWRDFWHRASRLLLAMDVDPLADIHRRLRRLEAANSTSGAAQHCVAPSGSTQQGDAAP